MGAALRKEGGEESCKSGHCRSPHVSGHALTSHEPWPPSRSQSLPPQCGSGQNPAAQDGRRRTCPHLSLAKDTGPQFLPTSQLPSGNPSRLNPFPSPGVPFPERGFEQRRDVRPLDIQIRRSAFRHLLPLAVAEAAATAAARPRALWEWRPAAPPSRRSKPKETWAGGASLGQPLVPGADECTATSAASLRPPPAQHLAWPPPAAAAVCELSGLGDSARSRNRGAAALSALTSAFPSLFPTVAWKPFFAHHSRLREWWGGGRGDG